MESNLREIGRHALERFTGLPVKNHRRLVERELDFWESEVFPVLDDYLVAKYPFVCSQILAPAGFTEITPDKLKDVIRRVRNKRAKQGARSGSVAVETVQLPPTRVATASEGPAAPWSGVQVPGSRPSSFKKAGGAVEPIPLVGKDAWSAQWARLALESSAGWSEWNGHDQTIWNLIAGKAAKDGLDIHDIEQRHKYQRAVEDSSERTYRQEKNIFDKYDFCNTKP